MKHIIIIGNGISGITAARHIRKLSNYKISVISAESEYFFSRPALMYIYMGHMPFVNTKPYEDWFWKKNNIELIKALVTKIDFTNKELLLDNEQTLNYDDLIIATGSKPNFLDWPGKSLKGVQGLVSLQDLQLMEENTKGIKKAVVVGGGLIGIEMVEMLLSRNIEVTFLVREFRFWKNVLPEEESKIIQQHIDEHHVTLKLNCEVKEFKGDDTGKLKSVITSSGEEIPCEFAGITIGVTPNIDFLKNSGLKINKGILVNEYMETNIPGVYAIGDCAEFSPPLTGRLSVEQIWYTGRMHGESVAYTICKKRTPYRPVNFFNSAKILDIEYQVYSKNTFIDNHCDSVIWYDQKEKKSIRIYYHADRRFEGIVSLGIRYRHTVFDKWLRENKSVEFVLEHLSDANFDPEFYTHYEHKLIEIYNKKHNKNLKLKKKNLLRIFS
jgi:NADPH-dependent 2,4-dienoyl-CoA reductase/sulfur reductase-like enzyme